MFLWEPAWLSLYTCTAGSSLYFILAILSDGMWKRPANSCSRELTLGEQSVPGRIVEAGSMDILAILTLRPSQSNLITPNLDPTHSSSPLISSPDPPQTWSAFLLLNSYLQPLSCDLTLNIVSTRGIAVI